MRPCMILLLAACVHQGRTPSTPGLPAAVKVPSGSAGSPGVIVEFLREKYRASPVYPEDARKRGEEGDCKIKILIDRSGVPVSFEVVACPKDFQQAAADAAMASSFYPREPDAMPELVAFIFAYHFNLSPPK